MSVELTTYLSTAKELHTKIENHCLAKRPLTLLISDTLYQLRLIKISVGYRIHQENLHPDEKSLIDEITQLYLSAEKLIHSLEKKSQVS